MNNFSFIPQTDTPASQSSLSQQLVTPQTLNFTTDFSSFASADNLTF